MAGQSSKKDESAPPSSSGTQAPPTMDVPLNLLEKLLKQMRLDLNLGPMLSLLTQPPTVRSTPIPTPSDVTEVEAETANKMETVAAVTLEEATEKGSQEDKEMEIEERRIASTQEEEQATQEQENEEGGEEGATDGRTIEVSKEGEDVPPEIENLEEERGKEEVREDEDDDLIVFTMQDILVIRPNIPTPAVKPVQEGEDAGVYKNAPAEKVSKRRRRMIVEEPEETSGKDEEDKRQRLLTERKRKGKELAGPTRKKTRPVSKTITIREPSLTRSDQPPPAEKVPVTHPYNREVYVKIDDHLLQQVVRFDNPKLEDECAKRLSPVNMVNSGKKLHHPSLQRLGQEAYF
ncbi:hypothetical protein AAHA92_33868 [Salvia divinorum]|uniref:Uncharacterized protein n=1 Tax=Salvia divinorum TaxID=28513 RepID=A0ABD1FH23_SALDI